VYLNKYQINWPTEIWTRLRAELMGSASVSIFHWREFRQIQWIRIQLF